VDGGCARLTGTGEAVGIVRAARPSISASTRSHAELDSATELDEGDPLGLARAQDALRPRLPNLAVVGGCCGTDSRHVAAMWAAP
jgi:S-methylmethionine-dependent homocysteine/selenocysteine methylase